MEKASPAIIKTIMEDAPIRDQLLNEGFLMVQVNEKMVSVNTPASMVSIIFPDDTHHGLNNNRDHQPYISTCISFLS